ncbi:MAG TPA: glycolate oxidase subunit GlcE [Stellaceae bacterium]|nr:glycolate oxidase subunit GlcE [Stellaceae bacterium]
MTRHLPRDERDLAEILAGGDALEIIAGGSKRRLGRAMEPLPLLDLSGLTGIVLYEPEELVLTAKAATPMVEIEEALAAHGQMLAFEPGDWAGIFATPRGRHTLGGVIACNIAGPRRLQRGAARDHFLGFRAVNGRGELFKSGGRVVKNVTGYDLSKLMAGSYGTLGVMTELSIKVVPKPALTATLALRGLDDARAILAMRDAVNSPHELSGAAHLPAAGLTLLRLEGTAPSVKARVEALRHELSSHGEVEALGPALDLWREIAEAAPLNVDKESVLWRISLPAASAPGLVARVARGAEVRYFLDWGGGLVWLAVRGPEDGGAGAIRSTLRGQGHATLIRGPDELRRRVPVFEPQSPALAALSARVKTSFDPRHLLNPGRMYPEL